MTYQTLLFEIKDGVAFVTVNRPDKLNALNDQVMLELGNVADRIATEPEIKGAILTGAGPKSFVAGADIGDLSRQGPFDGKARAQRGQAVLRRLETCGKPVIAAINGFALGGGCELAMVLAALPSSIMTWSLSALSLSGRLMVTNAMPSRISKSRVW